MRNRAWKARTIFADLHLVVRPTPLGGGGMHWSIKTLASVWDITGHLGVPQPMSQAYAYALPRVQLASGELFPVQRLIV